ncbi:MAG: TolC family protein [Flavobacteriales bacterium]|nr:TolC family protein [Flavobacteriales bacterium]
MKGQFHRLLSISLLLVFFTHSANCEENVDQQEASLVFSSFDEVIQYLNAESYTEKNNQIELEKAQKAKLTAALGAIDITGNILSAQFTDNTTLGVSLFPAEFFGGEPGTFQEVQNGVRYNTNLTYSLDVKVINPTGWTNLRLAKINQELVLSNNVISRADLNENVASAYFNVLNIQEQIKSSEVNEQIADTLFTITESLYKEGQVNQQDWNDSKVNLIQAQEDLRQLNLLLEQYVVSFKLLCNIPSNVNIQFTKNLDNLIVVDYIAELDQQDVRNALLQEEYYKQQYRNAQSQLLPVVSLQLSNSNNLYNQEFSPLDGDWINSNYIGVRASIPIPSANTLTSAYNAKFEHEMAQNRTKKNKLTLF